MTTPSLLPLPYLMNSLDYFHSIAKHLPMGLILQSDISATSPATTSLEVRGRFDIMTAAPEYWIESFQGRLTWQGQSPPDFPLNGHSSLSALRQLLEHIQQPDIDYTVCNREELPFCGGLVGYCSYDLAREYISLNGRAVRDIEIPDMQFGFYTWACIQDHRKQKSWLVIHPQCTESLRGKLTAILSETRSARFDTGKETRQKNNRNFDARKYSVKFKKIMDYIHAGDCYQINFSQRFTSTIKKDSIELYESLREIMPSPFCAYLPFLQKNLNHTKSVNAIISLSPERFIKMDCNRLVTSQPIKGTAARSSDKEIDRKSAENLQNDKKNLSENLMIVDLLRNDMGRVCETGSIKVKNLFELQSFSNVHHLVSTIEGKLKSSFNAADLLMATFPGGSITGAPKIRAMEIIDELESTRRSIYCGSILYFSSHGAMDSSILIRTVLLHDQKAYCWGGGGIVADSDCNSEYQESITKIHAILDVLQNP